MQNPRPELLIFGLILLSAVGYLASSEQQLEDDVIISRIRRNSRSKRSLDLIFNITTPSISAISWNNEVTAVEFVGLCAKFSVTMTRNKDLIRPGAELLRRTDVQQMTETLSYDSHKHFIGHVVKKDPATDEELGRGIAAFTQTDGLDGSLYIDGMEIKVMPLETGSSVYDQHIIYRAEEEKGDLSNDMIRIAALDTSGFETRRRRRDLAIPVQNIELMAVIEFDVFMELEDAAVDYMLSSINLAQAIFMDSSLSEFGVKVKFTVVKMVVMETQELLNLIGRFSYGDITDLFSTFAFAWEKQLTWRDGGESDLKYYDVAFVLGGTSVADNGNDVGLSSFQGCHPNNHYLAVKYYSKDHTARVLARQFGHILGMDNDELIDGCTEDGIMSDVNKLKFTSCNRYDAMTYLSSNDGDCFSDAPNGTLIFEVLNSEDERLDHDCYLKYAANSSFYSEEVCPWRKTYQTGDCHIWCNVVNMDLMVSDCTTQGQMPTFVDATCGFNRVCDAVLGCICPEGVTCNTDGDGKGLEGIDHYRVVTASTYEGARQECIAYGGALANIRNVDIQNHLATFLEGYPEHDKFYFGLHQEESSGYILLSNEDEPVYFNWAGIEPDEKNNHCVVLSRADGYQWLDYGCSEAIGSVCEIGVTPPVTYWLPQPTREHSLAKANCELYGGRLSKITDATVKANIENHLSGIPAAQTTTGIYLQLQKVDGVWKYEDGHELRLWSDWTSGEPANNDFDCVVLSPTNSYQWVAENCSEHQRLHLCEFDCVVDTAWCQRGVVTEAGGSCSCVCDSGWTGMFCLQPDTTPTVRYMLSDTPTNYVNASQACSGLGGQLARPVTSQMFQNIGEFATGNGETEVLFGLHKTGEWWVTDDDLHVGEFSAWLGDNPGSNDCAAMRYDSSWMWVGTDCTTSTNKYVCEFDCTVDTTWCVNGDVIMDAQEGCFCQCYYTWTGEFCSERHDIKYWLNPISVDGYDDASAKCSARFGRLAVVPNAVVQSSVGNFLSSVTLSNSKVYFDIHKVNGVWINADGDQVYNNWAFSFQDEHDCSYLNEEKNYEWTPGLCTWGNGRLSLCEFDCTHSDWCHHGTVVSGSGTCSCLCDEYWEGTFCEISTTTTLPPTTTPEPIDPKALWLPQVQYKRSDAQLNCEAYMGNLAKVNTKSTQARAENYINGVKDYAVGLKIYFGLHLDNGVWRYEDGEALTGYANWANNEPETGGLECGGLRPDNNYQWFAVNCSKNIDRSHLCEFDCLDGAPWCRNGGVININSVNATCTCDCPPGWSGMFCLEPDPTPNVRYRLSEETANFIEAKAACSYIGGILTRVQSNKMYENLMSYVLPTLETEVLIGLNKANGIWMADDTNQQGAYSGWVDNVGNSPAGKDCAYISVVDNKWYMVDCSIQSRKYVCEFDCSGGSWCQNGVITAHAEDGCVCSCHSGWSGEFCEVATDFMYWVNLMPVSGLTANDECVAMGGRLAVVPNFGTQDAIGAFISTQAVPDDRLYFDLWKENDVWINSDGLQDYFDWAFSVDALDDCAVLRRDKDYGFQSLLCTAALGRLSICEFDCLDGTPWCRNNGQVTMDPVNGYCSCSCAVGWKGPFCLQPDTPPTVRYHLSSASTEYTSARDSCDYIGGDLARMQSPEMFENLRVFIDTTTETEVLIGLHKINGVWMADGTNQQGGYSLWNTNVANDPVGKDCAYVSVLEGVVEWYMTDCTIASRKHVCEFDCSGGTWCNNGVITAHAEEGCFCSCNSGWSGEFCEVYTDLMYWVNLLPVSGLTANDECVAMGGRLAVVPNFGTQQGIGAFISTQTVPDDSIYFDLRKENDLWVNSDGQQDYFDWAFSVDAIDDCAVLRKDKDYGFQPLLCTAALGRLSICEFDCLNGSPWCRNGGQVTIDLENGYCSCTCAVGWKGPFCLQPDTPATVRYRLSSTPADYITAWDTCEYFGGDLARMQSPEMFDNLMAFINTTAESEILVGLYKSYGAWMADDVNQQGGFTLWNKNAANNPEGKECTYVSVLDGVVEWYMIDCTANSRKYICEFDCSSDLWCINGQVVADIDNGCACACSQGWTGEFCEVRNDVRYWLNPSPVSGTDAADGCLARGGRLAVSPNPGTNKMIGEFLDTKTTAYTKFFFDLKRVNDVWVNQDGDQDFFKWEFAVAETDECGTLRSDREYGWQAVPCSWANRLSVCELDCTTITSWCAHGTVQMLSTGCRCDCSYAWTGEFCDVPITAKALWMPQAIFAWNEAKENCEMYGGRLLNVDSANAQARAQAYLEGVGANPASGDVIIGIIRVDGAWVYYQNNIPTQYTNWTDGEPLALYDCSALEVTDNYMWVTEDCAKYWGNAHVCEFDCIAGASWCTNGDVVIDSELGTCSCVCHTGWQGQFCLEPAPEPTVRYRLSPDAIDYTDSVAACSENGGRLARILSQQAEQNVISHLGTTSATDVMFGIHKVNNVWMYGNDTQQSGYTNWHSNIGHSTNIGKECAYISLAGAEWEWSMINCGTTGRKHLCEFDCSPSATWCVNGVIETDPTEGCVCTCNTGWTGEFCEVRSDIMYWLNPNIVKGSDAPGECLALNGRLAPSTNKGTQAAIESFLQTQTPSNARIYIGLQKEDMVWVNDYGPQEYFNWLWDVEINDTCAAVRTDREYQWQPRPCRFANSLSLCEFECVSQTSWCVNGVVTQHAIGCECSCNTGWTGTFCDVATTKKRSIRSVTEESDPSVGDSVDSESSGTGGSSADSGDNAGEIGKYYYGIYRSKEANKYDYVYPECETYGSGIQKDCLMKAFGCDFYFNLTENIELIVPSAKIVHFKGEDNFTSEFIKPKNCHFMGPVTRRCGIAKVKESHGRAAVSPCGSMGGSLFFDDMRYNVLPVESNSREFRGTYMLVENPEEDHPLLIDIFRVEDVQEAGPPKALRPTRHTHARMNQRFTKARRQRRLRKRRKPETDRRREIHVELMLTVNYDVYKEYGDDAAMLAVTLINNVQAIYLHESLYQYGIHVILHVINVQILEEPILEDAYKVQRWADISDIYMAYKTKWEPKFWDDNDQNPDHYDAAILLSGSSVVDTRDDTGLSNFQSCNTEPCSVVKLSSFEGARGTIAHEIGLMLGMYYDQLDPNCHGLDSASKTKKGIMLNADRVYFTECNRKDLLDYVNKPYITCFDNAPIPGDWQTMLTYPLQADVICKTLFENNPEYYSERSCPWRKPELTGDCELWCEYVEIASGSKGCMKEDGAIPEKSEIHCGKNKICSANECVCKDGVSCLSKREEEPVSPAKYKIIHSSHLSWNEATRVCLDMNGEPVHIPNEATRLALIDVIKARPAHDKFFLGFRRNNSDSNEWLTLFQETITFFDWAESEPNDNDKECAVLSRKNNYKWSDHHCYGGASSICMFSCHDDSWCIHGNITITGDTCSCECAEDWKGEFCDEFLNALPPKYIMADHKMNYYDAKSYCEERNGNLPSALDEAKYANFTMFLQSSEHPLEDFYIDLELVMYVWRDSHSKAPHITKWTPAEPKQGQVCTLASGANSYNWISSNCSEEKYVVCQFSCKGSEEKWCRQGDLVDNGAGVCECICWPGSYGTFCEKYNYPEVIHKMILFYETQRSGILPPDNRIPWRGDSALYDMGLHGEDLTGGWYDAGDHVKFSMTLTNNLWKLVWGLYEFRDAYEDAWELDYMYDCVRWGLDYVMKCHTQPNEFYAMVGNPDLDHGYWGRPEQMTMNRTALLLDTEHPGSDIAGNAAASLALAYMVFLETDPAYAALLLSHARELYDFANVYRGKWSDSVYTGHYTSSSFYDELTNAAVCMYRATGEQNYLDDAMDHYDAFGMDRTNTQFSWSTITSGMQITMYLATNNQSYLEPVFSFFNVWFPGDLTYYTPKGLAWRNQFQPLKHTANVAFLATVCAKYGINTEIYTEWARSQIHYILGDGGRSYVSGFGKDPPQRVHHRGSSCPSLPEPCNWATLHFTAPNPEPLYGALVGGPDKKDNYDDVRTNWLQNEAGIYSSGFLSAVAGLKYMTDLGF